MQATPSPRPFQSVAILAPGLIGGSIGLALKQAARDIEIRFWARREEALESVRGTGMASLCSTDPCQVVDNADIVILCTPIGAMRTLAKSFIHALKPKCVVTDVGSTKKTVDQNLSPLFTGKALWCGSHPMAGKERTGFAAAEAGLFHDATAVITPTESTKPEAVTILTAFWKLLGCHVLTIPPEAHDHYVAQISHFPHLLASLVVNNTETDALKLMGPGYRDFTRIAASSPDLWQEILLANRKGILESIDRLIVALKDSKNILEKDDTERLYQLLAQASNKRKTVREIVTTK